MSLFLKSQVSLKSLPHKSRAKRETHHIQFMTSCSNIPGWGRVSSLTSQKDQFELKSRIIGVKVKVNLQVFYDFVKLSLKSSPLGCFS